MMKIHRTKDRIEMNGHAESAVQCAMITALAVSLLNNIQRMTGKKPTGHLDVGTFELKLDGLDETGAILVKAFWNSVLDLANDYPNSFQIV